MDGSVVRLLRMIVSRVRDLEISATLRVTFSPRHRLSLSPSLSVIVLMADPAVASSAGRTYDKTS